MPLPSRYVLVPFQLDEFSGRKYDKTVRSVNTIIYDKLHQCLSNRKTLATYTKYKFYT